MLKFNGRPVGTLIRVGSDTTYFVRQPNGTRNPNYVEFPKIHKR